MVTEKIVFAILMAGVLFSAILYLAFGRVTVRKLRKKPETKNELGLEFVSGWDIINVAQALALPKSITIKLRNSQLSSIYANSELLHKNTTVFDRLLAVFLYFIMTSTGLGFALWALLDTIGIIS